MMRRESTSQTHRRPRVLMVTHRVPYPPNKGDRIRSWHILNTLSQTCDVWLACASDGPLHLEWWRRLRELTAGLVIKPAGGLTRAALGAARGVSLSEGAFTSGPLKREIDRWSRTHGFDAALCVCSSMAHYVADLPISRKIIDLVDVDSLKWSAYADLSPPHTAMVYRMESRRVQKLERSLADKFNAVGLVSPNEAQDYQGIAPTARVFVATNGVDLDYFTPAPDQSQPTAVFTGAMDYKPNIEGVGWFLSEVWWRVRRRVPDARFWIVGANPPRSLRRLAARMGAEVIGQTEDVRPYLAQAAAAVAPLMTARGVQNKVLEAMAMGKPVLASPQAIAGIGAQDARHLLTAQCAIGWTDRLTKLFQIKRLRHALGLAARNYVEKHHDWEQCLTPLIEQIAPQEAGRRHITEPSTITARAA